MYEILFESIIFGGEISNLLSIPLKDTKSTED